MKLLFLLIVLAGLAFVVVHYVQPIFTPPASGCPNGSTYVRNTMGGGWAPTDASDPFGKCVSNAEISAAQNQ